MHIDARELENNSMLEADICIVGAGPAGISMALDFANDKRKVILLESGGFEYDDALQDTYKGESTGQPYFPLRSTRLHYFGGTSGHWGGFCAKLDAIDFEKRPWINDSGWPITIDAIEPFYPRAHELVELGTYHWDAAYWINKQPKNRSLFPGNKYLWDKIWKISPPTRFGDKYRSQVVNAPNVYLYTYANVTDITTNEAGDRVTEMTVANLQGKTHTVKAKIFVLAMGGIQNARMLLASNKQQPKGLGNEYDVVGRYFMEHIEIRSGEIWLLKANDLEFYMLNREARSEIAVTANAQKELGISNGTVSLRTLDVGNRIRPHNKSWATEDPRENMHTIHEEMEDAEENKFMKHLRKNKRKAFSMYSRFESVPNRSSRIYLDEKKDAFGIPLASLHWQLSDIDKISMRSLHQLIGQQLGALGLGRLRMDGFLEDATDNSWPDSTSGGWHHIGTTRMGTDKTTSVVDSNCRMHSIENLYCAGASCFSTSGAANPTLSLVALSLRLSDYLKKL